MVLLTCLRTNLLWAEESSTGGTSQTPAPDSLQLRINEIAGWLPTEPTGLGPALSDRVAWAKARVNRASVLAKAEKKLQEPTPPLTEREFLDYSRSGKRDAYDKAAGERLARLSQFCLAEGVENQGRFLSAIQKELEAMLAEPTWVLPPHDKSNANYQGKTVDVDLGVAMRAWTIVTADSWLGEKLPESLRKKIREEVQRRVLQPYLDKIEGRNPGLWWVTTDNNWNAVCHAGVIGCALALEPDPKRRARFLAEAERKIRRYLDGFRQDGYCSEGLGYWNYGFSHFAMLAESVYRNTGGKLDWYALPHVPEIAAFPKNLYLFPDIYPIFADNWLGSRPDEWTQRQLAQRTGNPSLGPVDSSGWKPAPIDSVFKGTLYATALDIFDPPPPGSSPAHALRGWFPDAVILVSRPASTGDRRLAAAFKGGNNGENHGHHDVGTLVIATGAAAPLLDVGGEAYTARTFGAQRYDSTILNSYGHSVPVVDGRLQINGKTAEARVVSTDFSEAEDRLTLDLSSCYDSPKLSKLHRTFRYVRGEDPYVEVTDDAEFSEPAKFGAAFITTGKIQAEKDGTWRLVDGRDSLEIRFAKDTPPLETKSETLPDKPNSGGRDAKRLGYSLIDSTRSAKISFIIRPCNSSGDAAVAGDEVWEKWPQLTRQNPTLKQEAESPSSERGGKSKSETRTGSSGKALMGWDAEGHALEYAFQIPKDGRFALQIRYCRGLPGMGVRRLKIDGHPAPGITSGFDLPGTGGWSRETDDWKNVWLVQSGRPYLLDLSKGPHQVTLENLGGGGTNLDWLALVEVREKPVSPSP
ncbi:MAG: heparinase [Verrucomicrobia bacterium]|nr:heparinase [Verrucomicrobiota bacterium]